MSQTIPILMYHSISQPVKNAPFKCLHLPPKRFALQMRLLNLLGYQGLSMDKLTPYLTGEKQGKVVGITFDDGYKNNLTHALPILQKYDFSATCYVVTGCVGEYNRWDESKGIPKNPLMTLDELKQWVASGMSVGAHTHYHVSLPSVDDNTAWQEIHQSKQFLETHLQQPIEHFCYPYGHFKPQHVEMLKQAGFISSTAMYRGRVKVPSSGLNLDERLTLARVTVNNNCYPHIFLMKLLTGYEDKKGLKLLQK
jgi:peptidoglycan/xylan/chitin deacetylase (PgdA/CDA1 family)